MTEPVETELVARLREFVVSDELGNSDFSVCDEAADEIERLQAELREACHERDGYMAERDMARERLEWSSDQPYDGIAARDETIVGLQAELARVRKLGEAMAEDAAVRISQADMERATKAVKSAGIERARIAPQPPRHLYAIAPGEPIRKPARGCLSPAKRLRGRAG